MDKTVEIIYKVVATNLLIKGLYYLPHKGASEIDIKNAEEALGLILFSDHKNFLKYWNGANLDIIRLFGCGQTEDAIPNISSNQFGMEKKDFRIIASDPAGFIYVQDNMEKIFSFDTDGGIFAEVGKNFEDFICNYLFGLRAKEFAGEQWFNELKEAGIIT